MAEKLNLEFDCPQFVDFAAELNSSSKDDVFFDCKDYQTPSDESIYESLPTSGKNQYAEEEEEENKLIEKMTAALSVIENTPKLKLNTVKGKHLAEAFVNNMHSQTVKPVNANTVSAVGLHRSKSIARLNKIITESQNKFKGLGKRSSSLNDLRAFKKPTYATTPMCLKRTIVRAKGRVIKTTEEMELEEIARLQKQLKEHLRYNEMTLKKLKLKPRPCQKIMSKNPHAKPEILKGNKGLNPSMEKLNTVGKGKGSRKTIPTLSHVSMKNEAMKIENIIKGQSAMHKLDDKGLKENKRSRHPSASSDVEVNDKNKTQATKKPVIVKKIGFHSGLVFHDNVKKNTVVQPFSFDVKIREKIGSTGAEQKAEVSHSNSTLKYKVDDGKENIPYNNPQSTFRQTRRMHNTKCDIVKQLASNKKIVDKYIRNPMRGLPLSENIARK